MKNALAATILLIAATWSQAQVVAPDGAWQPSWPTKIVLPDRTINNPTRAECEANGYREVTQLELDDKAIADAIAASNALVYADTQPIVFVPRISGSLTNVVGESQVFADDETDELFVTDETGSPEHTLAQKQAQRDEQKATRTACRTMNGELKDSIAANIEAAKALSWTNQTAGAQADQIKELRRLVIQIMRDQQTARRMAAKAYREQED